MRSTRRFAETPVHTSTAKGLLLCLPSRSKTNREKSSSRRTCPGRVWASTSSRPPRSGRSCRRARSFPSRSPTRDGCTRARAGAREGGAGRQERRAVDHRRRERRDRPARVGQQHLRRVRPAGAGHGSERHGVHLADARGPAQGGSRRDRRAASASGSRPARRFGTPTSTPSTSSATQQTVGGAVKTMLAAAVFPADADDLAAVAGRGVRLARRRRRAVVQRRRRRSARRRTCWRRPGCRSSDRRAVDCRGVRSPSAPSGRPAASSSCASPSRPRRRCASRSIAAAGGR